MARIGKVLIVFLLGALFPFGASADVTVSLNPKRGTVNEVFILTVTVSDEDSAEIPEFEESDDFQIEQRGTESHIMIMNGKHRRTQSFTYSVLPQSGLKAGKYTLPPGRVEVGGKEEEIRPLTITIEAKAAKKNTEKGAEVDFIQVVSNLRPYVGEQVTYRAEVASAAQLTKVEASEIQFSGFWKESLGNARKVSRQIAGTGTKAYTIQEALFPTSSGKLLIPERTVTVEKRVPAKRQKREWSVFDEVWPFLDDELYDTVEERYSTEPITIEAMPLPPSPDPSLSYIPVGTMRVLSSVDKNEIKEGDAVTLTVELISDGNLRPYELSFRDVSGFKIYPEKPYTTTEVNESRVLFRKRFVVAFVPESAGEVELPVLKIVSFDPTQKRYNIAETSGAKIRVQKDPNASALVVHAPERAPERVSAESELRPLHSGKVVLDSALPLSKHPLGRYLLILPAMLSLLLALGAVMRRSVRREANPLKLALTDIEKASSAGELLAAIRRYIGRKFAVEGESLTAREASALLQKAHVPANVQSSMVENLELLERIQYSGSGAELPPGIKESALLALKEFDRA